MKLKLLLRILALGVALMSVQPGAEAQMSLISTNTVWHYLADGSDQGTAWQGAGFDDNGWSNGVPLFGVDSPGIYPWPFRAPIPVGGGRITYYFRTHFNWSGNTAGAVLNATGYFDDGAAVYLNGAEAGRVRLTNHPVLFDSLAINQGAEGTADALNLATGSLVAGDNVLAVEVHQTTTNSSDVVFGLTLEGRSNPPPDATPPTITQISPLPGSAVSHLTQIEVEFSEPVTGVDADDLRIGGVPVTGVSPDGPARYTFTFSKPPDGLVAVAWAPAHGIQDLGDPPNAFAGGGWTYTLNAAPSLVITCASNKVVECAASAAGPVAPAYAVLRHFSAAERDGHTPRGLLPVGARRQLAGRWLNAMATPRAACCCTPTMASSTGRPARAAPTDLGPCSSSARTVPATRC